MAARPYQSSPVKSTTRGFNRFSSAVVRPANKRKSQIRKNMEGYYLGPMDPTEFMTSFMPINSPNFRNSPKHVNFSNVYKQANERSMYGPLVSCSAVLLTVDLLTRAGPHSRQP